MPGRPTVAEDEQKVAGMIRAIEAGVPITQACLHAGVSYSAHQRAMDAGEQAEALDHDGHVLNGRQASYRAYRARVLTAPAKVAVLNVALVAQAAQGGQLIEETHRRYRDSETDQMVTETRKKYAPADWRASKLLLEVSFRKEFGRQWINAAEGIGGEARPVTVAGDDVLRSIAERLRAVQQQQTRQLGES